MTQCGEFVWGRAHHMKLDWKDITKRLMMGVLGMYKWENCYRPALQMENDSYHQRRLRSPCHKTQDQNKDTFREKPRLENGRSKKLEPSNESIEKSLGKKSIEWLVSTHYFDHL